MTKAVKMARVSAKGGFNLFWGLATSTIISALGVILVARILSPPEYGLIAIALMAPSLITLFRDWGVNSAIIKYTAQYRSENKTDIQNVREMLNELGPLSYLFKLPLNIIEKLTNISQKA